MIEVRYLQPGDIVIHPDGFPVKVLQNKNVGYGRSHDKIVCHLGRDTSCNFTLHSLTHNRQQVSVSPYTDTFAAPSRIPYGDILRRSPQFFKGSKFR